jgi:hypothetical protein
VMDLDVPSGKPNPLAVPNHDTRAIPRGTEHPFDYVKGVPTRRHVAEKGQPPLRDSDGL